MLTPASRCAVLAALVPSMLLACTKSQDGDESKASVPTDPVIVFAAEPDRTYLPALLEGYTRESGVVVIVRSGNPVTIVDDVIANSISPPADVLWTPSVAGVWRAAEEGALRPLRSQYIAENVPAWLRDPDDFWVGVSYRTAVLVYDPDVFTASDLSDYAALAEPRFRDRLCLSSSANTVNQTIIAMLIDALNVRSAEIAVRGWVANLALPVFANEDALLDAVQSGICGIGILSSNVVAAARVSNPAATIAVYAPAITQADAEAAGVARHARNPTGAAALVEWLALPETQATHADKMLFFPTNRHASPVSILDASDRDRAGRSNLILTARYRSDAIKLAERARYR